MTGADLGRAPVALAFAAIACALIVVLALWAFEVFEEWVGVVLERMSMPIPGIDEPPRAREQWPREAVAMALMDEALSTGAMRPQAEAVRVRSRKIQGE